MSAATASRRPELTPAMLAALEVIRTADQPASGPAWATMTPAQRYVTVGAMVRHGRGFDADLGDLCSRASPEHLQRLICAFPEILTQFGPGSAPYLATYGTLVGYGWTEAAGLETAA